MSSIIIGAYSWIGTADESAQIYDIFGIPMNGSAFEAYAITTIFGSFGEPYDTTVIANNLAALMVLVTAAQYTRIQSYLADWTSIGGTAPIKIYKSTDGSEGTIVNYEKQRENIRRGLSRIIGFKVPHGGFDVEKRGQGGVSR